MNLFSKKTFYKPHMKMLVWIVFNFIATRRKYDHIYFIVVLLCGSQITICHTINECNVNLMFIGFDIYTCVFRTATQNIKSCHWRDQSSFCVRAINKRLRTTSCLTTLSIPHSSQKQVSDDFIGPFRCLGAPIEV